MSGQTQQTQQVTSSNQGYNTSSVIEKRLETQALLDQIETFLRGHQLIPHEVAGKGIHFLKVPCGKNKCNDVGVQSIMAFMHSIINPSVVQGNLTLEQYGNYIYETNVSLVQNIVINSDNWQISDEDIEVICDFVMSLVIPYVSRTIDNKERESYDNTMHTNETNTVTPKSWLPFNK